MITSSSSLREVGFVVCSALNRLGITAVLSGGSAATVWAPQAYQSRDLDFIAEFYGADRDVDAALLDLGYAKKGRIYVHLESPLTLDFPAGPLAVGAELLTDWTTLRDRGQLLHVIHPTDSVLDRLAGFIHWHDRGSLEQALAVARAQHVDTSRVKQWCDAEGGSEQFAEFARLLG